MRVEAFSNRRQREMRSAVIVAAVTLILYSTRDRLPDAWSKCLLIRDVNRSDVVVSSMNHALCNVLFLAELRGGAFLHTST